MNVSIKSQKVHFYRLFEASLHYKLVKVINFIIIKIKFVKKIKQLASIQFKLVSEPDWITAYAHEVFCALFISSYLSSRPIWHFQTPLTLRRITSFEIPFSYKCKTLMKLAGWKVTKPHRPQKFTILKVGIEQQDSISFSRCSM